MEGLRWSRVLLQWVKDSELISCESESIEQCSVEDFYQQFRNRMQATLTIQEANIIDFLKVNFAHYELYLTESGQIAAPDHFYIFSLLLYFSCVRHPERFFQQICNGFDKPQQYAVTAFLKSMLEGNHLRQEIDRTMIRKAIQDAMPQTMLPPSSPQSNQKPTQLPMVPLLSVPPRQSVDVLDSPLRLNNRVPRISPPTPKTIILDERTRQLKELKAQLEAERYEKGYLEVQLKQLQDKNDKFLEDKRKHLKEIRELKAELQACNRENESPNKQRGADYKLARIERQLAEKEEILDRLKIELETVSENNKNATEMINYRNTQIVKLKDKILELEGSIVTLSECIEEKDEMIKCLRENNEDLQNFINENRLDREGAVSDNLNTSFECMELSAAANTTDGSGEPGKNYSTSPENMARAVVDVQLKEKEAENCLLKRSLEVIEQEKVRVSGLVGQFFRLYSDVLGRFPHGTTNPAEVGFVEKMNMFKTCYEALFEECGKLREGKEFLETRNEALEEDVRQLKGEVSAISDVLRNLENHSANIEKELAMVRKAASEYQRQNTAMEENLMKQKRDFLRLISDKDALQQCCQQLKEERETLSQQNLTVNVEYNSLKGEYESITQKIDYLMLSLNDDYEGSDFSSWFEKMDDLKDRLRSLKEDKEGLMAMNMKITVEKISLEKEISNGEVCRQLLQDRQVDSEKKILELTEQLQHTQASLAEREQHVASLERVKEDLEENIQGLSTELLEVQDVLQDRTEELQSSESSLQEVSAQLQLNAQELSSAQSANFVLQSNLNNQQTTIHKLEETQQEITAQKIRLQSKHDILEKNLLDKVQQLDETNHQLVQLKTQHSQLIEESDKLQQEKSFLGQSLVEQRDESRKSLELIQDLEAQIGNLEELVAQQAQQLEHQQCFWEKKVDEKQQQLEDARMQQELVTSANRSLLSGYSLMQNKIEQLEREYLVKIDVLQGKIGQLSGLLQTLSAYQFKLRFEKTLVEDNLVKMMEEFEILQQENGRLVEDKKTLQTSVREMQAERQTVDERNFELAEDLKETEDRLRLEENSVKRLTEEVNGLIIERTHLSETGTMTETALRKELGDSVHIAGMLRCEVEQVREIHTTLERQVQEKTEQLRLLSNERDELEVKCTRLEVDLKETQTDLEGQRQLTVKSSDEKTALESQLNSLRSALYLLEANHAQVESELSESQSELIKQNDTIQRLCQEKEVLEQKIQELATALAAIRQDKSAAQQALDQELEKSDELSCQLTNLNAKLTSIAEEMSRLADERDEMRLRQEQLVVAKEELTERVEELAETVVILEEDRDTLREEKCRLEAEVEQVDHDKESLEQQCGKLLAELSNSREAAVVEKASLEERIAAMVKDRCTLEAKVKQFGEEQELLNGRIQELEKSKQMLESALSDKGAVEIRVVELSEALDELRLEKTKLESDKASLMVEQQSNQATIEQLSNDRSQLKEFKAQLHKQIILMQEANGEVEKKLEHLSSVQAVAEGQIESLEEKVVILSETIATKEAEVIKQNAIIEDTSKNLLEVRASLKDSVEEMASVSEQLMQKTAELQSVQHEKEKEILMQSESIESVRKDHKEVSEKFEQVQEEKIVLETKVQQLTEELHSRTKRVASGQNEILARELDIQTLTEALAESEAKSADLSQQVEDIASAKNTTEARLIELENELDLQKQSLCAKQHEADELSERLAEAVESKSSLTKQLADLQTALDSQTQQLNQQLSEILDESERHQATIHTKDFEIHQLTEGLDKIKTFQSVLEEKVTDFEAIVAEKDEIEAQFIKLQNELELITDDKHKVVTELDKLRDDKSDVDRRLIQQLQDYDTLNEAFLNERDQNKELEKKRQELVRQMQGLVDEKEKLMMAHESAKSQLSTKEKRLHEQDKQMEKLKREIEGLFGKNQQMDSLSHELMKLKVDKTELQAKREELHETIEHQEIQEKALQENMQHLRESLKLKQLEMDTLHSDLTTLKETLHTLKIENSKLKSTQELQQTKMLNLELKNSAQCKKIEKLEESLSKTEISHLEDNSKATTLLKELEKYKEHESRMKELEDLHQKEREINERCVFDMDILKAKLMKNRKMGEEKEQQWNQERLALLEKVKDASKGAEEKVKEIRIEYEGKLEKMKDKMKSLYNDEMVKVKSKHEKDFLELKAELQQEMKKFNKMEIHAGKLQQQLCNLNEKNLALMKENEFVKSKMRIMEEIREERKSMLPPPAHARLCSNLKMEDEEGEVFNNTYLTDLKTGRGMSPPFGGRDSVRYSELAMRNSMLPPHLKSSYLPQYVDGDTDDDTRDTVSGNLDDSSTSLIARKKVGGTTSYKRPGPPTPSKKAGRLSFGGSLPTNDFQYKEILKDNSNGSITTAATSTISSRLSFGGRKSNVDSTMVAAAGSSGGSSTNLAEMNARRKTPGKFKQMFSSSNLLNTLHKDETPFKRDLSSSKFQHPAITKINCADDTDSASSGPDDRRARLRMKRESISLRTSKTQKSVHMRKMLVRFDKNRRLSSVDSDSPGSSPRNSGDPYGGFSYDGTPDRIKKIDINAMDVFAKVDRQTPKVKVFSGDKKDDNNNEVLGDCPSVKKPEQDMNNNIVTSDFVQRLSINRRDKQRRKSREQRRESFNLLRNIDGDAIVYRTMEMSYSDEVETESICQEFEYLLQEKVLDRPSEILPRGHPYSRQPHNRRDLLDSLDDVVTSSTGLRSVASTPLLERFSEIFRIATLQKEKSDFQPPRMPAKQFRESSATGAPSDRMFTVLDMLVVSTIAAFVFGIYLFYPSNT